MIRLCPGTPTPIDVLCRKCLNPAMMEVPIVMITGLGVDRVGRITFCTDCTEEVMPL